MLRYILQRLLLLIPTLFGILAITFAVIQFVPGGPVEQMVTQLTQSSAMSEAGGSTSSMLQRGNRLSAEDMAQIQALYGFDKPPLERFTDMIGRFLRFDLGESFSPSNRVRAGETKIAGINEPRLVDIFPHLSHLYPAGHCQSRARRQPF